MINLLPGIESTTSALQAERTRMDVVSQNIANAQVTRGANGKPYQRQQVVFEALLRGAQQFGSNPSSIGPHTLQVARIEPDSRPPLLLHNPDHPDANANGQVAYPNINVHLEMVDLLAASRAYEANLAVVKTARSMANQTLSIGKR
jgi:flagellar basal-body rod protein FlgC